MSKPPGARDRHALPGFTRGSPLVEDAFGFAAEVHHGARRQDDTDVGHPAAVGELLREAGFSDEIVAAALLHDVVEDTATELAEIDERFGRGVHDLVEAMTEDESIEPYEDRKAEHRERIVAAGPDVAAIYAADKLAKARQLADPDEIPPAKLAHYVESLRLIRNRYPELPFLDELAAELADLRARRGGS